MGRIIPDSPRPARRPADACAQAQCAYCKRYGPLGSCEGCGAPNRPIVLTDPEPLRDQIEVTVFGDAARRYIDGLPLKPEFPPNRIIREGAVPPRFDRVRR